METNSIFKVCPKCSASWESREAFLTDKLVNLIGYQANFKNLDKGLLLFTHMANDCYSTTSIYVSDFDDLYTGVRYTENKALSEVCHQYCIDEKNFDRCDAKCECSYAREIIEIIRALKSNL